VIVDATQFQSGRLSMTVGPTPLLDIKRLYWFQRIINFRPSNRNATV
jgi:hypothetical protein